MFKTLTILFTYLCVSTSAPAHHVKGLIGYDCTASSFNITPVALTFPQSCDKRIPKQIPEAYNIQLLQRSSFTTVHTRSCLLVVSHLITHCGAYSHATIAKKGFRTGEIEPITREKCIALHVHQSYETPERILITHIPANSTSSHTVLAVGKVSTNEGDCHGADWYNKGRQYSDVQVRQSYTITVRDEYSVVDMDTNTLILSSGYRFPLGKGHGFDPNNGETFWDTLAFDENCTPRTHVSIYVGAALVFKSEKGSKILTIDADDQAIAVALTGEEIVCGRHGFHTEHPKLTVVLGDALLSLPTSSQTMTENLDVFLYMNSKFVFLESHFKGQLSALSSHLERKICETQHTTLMHLSALAYIDAEEFAWVYTKQAGVTAIVRGEVAYLMKCAPTAVTFRSTDRCFQEIPVSYDNRSMFIRPRTRILTEYGTEVDCNPLASSVFNILGGWFTMEATPRHTPSPTNLQVYTEDVWSYQSIEKLAIRGLYSESQLESLQKRLMFPIEKPAIENIITSRLAGQNTDLQSLNMMKLMTKQGIEDLSSTVWDTVTSWWGKFAWFSASISGIVIIYATLKWVGTLIVDGTALYQLYGCSSYILAAAWGTLARQFIYARKGKLEKVVRSGGEDGGEELTEVVSSAPQPTHAAESSREYKEAARALKLARGW